MKVLGVGVYCAEVALTVEECALLARVCWEVETEGQTESALISVLSAVFRALTEAGLARFCMTPKQERELERLVEEVMVGG